MTELQQNFAAHIAELQNRTHTILERVVDIDLLCIHAGKALSVFLDDMYYPFKTNPHFKAWLPVTETQNCWLMVNGKDKPVLVFYQPTDFWHKVTQLEDSYWTPFFDIKIIAKPDEVTSVLPSIKDNIAYIGAHQELARDLGFSHINPKSIIDFFHYHRVYKTDYELDCLRQANKLAVAGHTAAKNTFLAGGSEFDIQLAYLAAAGQSENEMPYDNIVALNENCAILHYTDLEKQVPQQHRSFLIDAGASFNGYAADITRTYAKSDNEFSALIGAVDAMQQRLVTGLKPGASYVDLHVTTHYQLAEILKQFDIVRMDPQDMVEQGITRAFFPHGLGHHLGLQVHDMGGFMANEQGQVIASPDQHPFLRTTRGIESKQVFTIEPGLYFIDEFLTGLAESKHSQHINWDKISELKPFGGIRIEDNIIVFDHGIENMTRDLGLA
ncbi:Xaa-Pro dipeptidase [Thalassotalea ponticola]|uniref:Xaa-Pro dipeptidase n=1 Tax=Thalassotalea ponticola TaxID=1523392 RepID=UPI0025B49747|nr:Xaa-Pro dipeptidase [Thalassotalea ponticola]MDN3653055.1 Xaa-Pro dipeptidase [Thalassotalea ponticola]